LQLSVAGTEIEGEYKEVPTGSYWNDVIVTIPNGAKNVQIIHNGLSTFAGMESVKWITDQALSHV
jgi:hypothetical protein